MSPQLAEFSSPSIEYSLLSPMLIVFGVAIAGILVEAFVPRSLRYLVQALLAMAGLVGAFIMTIVVAGGLPARKRPSAPLLASLNAWVTNG